MLRVGQKGFPETIKDKLFFQIWFANHSFSVMQVYIFEKKNWTHL